LNGYRWLMALAAWLAAEPDKASPTETSRAER
jgi:hypothetical protein